MPIRKVEYVVALEQQEVDAINMAIAAFLKIPIKSITLSDVEQTMYDDMVEEMKFLQKRFDDLKKLKNTEITSEKQ